MMYGAGNSRWKEYYMRKKKEDMKSNLILIYFGIVIAVYLAVIIFGA